MNSTVILFQIDIDDLLNEPVPGELQMVSLHSEEVKPPSLVQSSQANRVLSVERSLPERLEDVGLAWNVEFKVRGLPGLDHRVLVVLHHNEVLQAAEVDGVALVLDGFLVVDLRNEETFLHVSVEMKRIMPVLSLDQDVLHKVNIGPVVEEVPDNITERVHLSRTVGEAEDTLVLSSEGDQVLHGRLRTPLGHSSEELPALGEPDGVVTSGQLRVGLDLLTNLPHLPVGVAEEAALGVHDEVATDHDAVGVHIGDVVLYDVRNANHAGRTVPHAVPENHGGGRVSLAQHSQGLEHGQEQQEGVHHGLRTNT